MNFASITDKQKVFFFIPSYNQSPFVEKCLKFITKQTLSPIKLPVIGDDSKVNSQKTTDVQYLCGITLRKLKSVLVNFFYLGLKKMDFISQAAAKTGRKREFCAR